MNYIKYDIHFEMLKNDAFILVLDDALRTIFFSTCENWGCKAIVVSCSVFYYCFFEELLDLLVNSSFFEELLISLLIVPDLDLFGILDWSIFKPCSVMSSMILSNVNCFQFWRKYYMFPAWQQSSSFFKHFKLL